MFIQLRTKHIGRIIFSLISVLFIACSGCSVEHHKPKPKPKKPPLRLLWSFTYSGQSSDLAVAISRPVLIGDKVLITPDYRVTALNQQTGNVLWQVQNPDGTTMANARQLYDSTTFYIKGWKGTTLTAVNVRNGSIRWKHTLKKGKFTTEGSDAMGPHFLYIAGYQVYLYKFSKDSILQYRRKTVHTPRFINFYKDKLYIFQGWKHTGYKNTHGSVLCLNPATLDTLWTYTTHQGGYLNAAPIFKNDIIYAGAGFGDPGQVAALNAETGKVKWKANYWAKYMVLANDTLYVSSGEKMEALDAKTGHKLWGYNFESAGGGQPGLPGWLPLHCPWSRAVYF